MANCDLAWAAGLFEGEGTSFCSAAGQPVVALAMTDEDVVRRFHEIVGRGKTTHRVRQGNLKDVWVWRVLKAEDILAVLGSFWPFLGERRLERATEVIERAAKMGEKKGFCKRGHDLTDPQNVYIHKKTGKRHCYPCRLSYRRRRFLRLAV